MIEHDGCETCKHFNPKEVVVSSSSYCYDCSLAHTNRVLDDKYVPMTNADMIRRMSDEELAGQLISYDSEFGKCYTSDSEGFYDLYEAQEHEIKWLQSEAESVEE